MLPLSLLVVGVVSFLLVFEFEFVVLLLVLLVEAVAVAVAEAEAAKVMLLLLLNYPVCSLFTQLFTQYVSKRFWCCDR